MRRPLVLALLVVTLLAVACGRGVKEDKLGARAFPSVSVPGTLTELEDQVHFAAEHYWDAFTDTSKLYLCDSLHVNGCTEKDLGAQMRDYGNLLSAIPLKDARRYVTRLFDRLERFQAKYPSSRMFPLLTEMVSVCLYDVNSPVRNEDVYLPFVKKLASSAFSPDEMRPAYEYDVRMCSLNQEGTKAADIDFTDTKGHRRKLSDVSAEAILLFFNNPGCNACREIREKIQGDGLLSALVEDGILAVVTIYIDQELDKWKAASDEYPPKWICGYDHGYKIRSDVNYNVRAIPSLYLLDGNMTVLMKDAPIERIVAALYSMAGAY